MNALAPIHDVAGLPALIRSAASKLAAAETSAEVLSARDDATLVYDTAKIASRMARAKAAHDDVVTKAMRAQADALDIESAAKRILADEYDAAQKRGEIRSRADNQHASSQREEAAGAADIGLTHKEVHDSRQFRDAEKSDPGIVRRSLDKIIDDGREPTRAALKREVFGAKPKPKVADDSLWLWGRLRDFERHGYFKADPARLLIDMTAEMRADVQRLAPLVRELMEELEVRFVPA